MVIDVKEQFIAMSTLEQAPVDDWTAPLLREVVPEAESAPPRSHGVALRRTLIALDLSAVIAGWCVAVQVTPGVQVLAQPRMVSVILSVVVFVALVSATMGALASQRLYLSRVCAIRAVEISRIARACVLAGMVALLVPRAIPVVFPTETAVVGGAVSFLFLIAVRGGFRSWLHAGRRKGRYLRPVVIIGGNEEAAGLCRLVTDHPETGFAVAAIAAPEGRTSDDVAFPRLLPRLPLEDDLPSAVRAAGANGVLIASSAVSPSALNRHVRALLRSGLHVHLSSGLSGVAHSRLRSQPMAHEPLLYVEAASLATWQLGAKRVVDVVLTLVGSIVVLPVLAVAALAVKLQDRGPVLYRQVRVGKDGQPFTIFKLRTMVPGADRLYDVLAETMGGREGPLIKLSDDPRRTPVGRLLERCSIDELPQVWNVLRGEMSLVGPRPAQASEIEKFDEELRRRLTVRPGITGLWQVEARDNPSFDAYRRYDLFYLENWSVTLDLAILISTFGRVASRGLSFLWNRDAPEVMDALRGPTSRPRPAEG